MTGHDWYTIETPYPGLFAIGEPRYSQQNWSYLIHGTERALLFDTGSFFGEVAPLVSELNDLPLTVLPSHMHFDHLGNVTAFDRVVLADLPVLRACEADGCLIPAPELFLGEGEGREPPRFAVTEWLPVGTAIDLGDVVLTVLHTPGHSPDSVSLWWNEADILLAADFIYHGPLYAQVPGASLADYIRTGEALRAIIGPATRIFGAHGDAASAESAAAPELDAGNLDALLVCLRDLRDAPPAFAGAPVERRVSSLNTVVLSPEAMMER